MLTLQELEKKLQDVIDKVQQSLGSCQAIQSQLEQMRANHNALLGAQMLAQEMVDEAKKKGDVSTEC